MPHSFSYIADERTRALVIGSMPGEASLAAGGRAVGCGGELRARGKP